MWGAAFVLAALSRVPLWLDHPLTIDGDEAVLALVARGVLEGEWPGVFFPGQRYGLAILESSLVAAGFWLFSDSEAVLRAAISLAFAAGVAFLALAMARLRGNRAAWLTVLLLVSCPAWFEFSMKARSGYVSAFLVSGVCAWLAARLQTGQRAPTTWAALGVSVLLVAWSQALFLLVLLPFVVMLPRDMGRREWAWMLLPAAALLALVGLGGDSRVPVHQLAVSPQTRHILDVLTALPVRLVSVLGGRFEFNYVPRPTGVPLLAGLAWMLVYVSTIVVALAGLRRGLSGSPSRAAVVALLLCTSVVFLVDPQPFPYRYLLPLPVLMVVLLALEWDNPGSAMRAGMRVAVLTLVLTGTAAYVGRVLPPATPPVGPFSTSMTSLRALASHLQGAGIANLYVPDPIMRWQLQYTGRGRLTTHGDSRVDRLPGYAAAVDTARESGLPTAMVLRPWLVDVVLSTARAAGIPLPPLEQVGDEFWLLRDPPAALLRALGVQIDGSD